MSHTPRLALPFLVPGQAQKELFHNEALQALDALVAAVVEGDPSGSPPESPLPGQCFIVAAGAVGEWAGQSGSLAVCTEGGWRFVTPFEGLTATMRDSGNTATYRAGAWEIGSLRGSRVVIADKPVVGSRKAAIADPQGGQSPDPEARSAIGAILAAMRQHGLIEM